MDKLITFEQIKTLVIYNYSSILTEWGEKDELHINRMKKAKDIDELVKIIENMGLTREDAFIYIFDTIIKD